MSIRLFFLMLCALAPQEKAPASGDFVPAPGHWPQWRGPERDGVSIEKELLHEWPLVGPSLMWKTTELGDGFPPVSVAGGRIYGIGYKNQKEYVTVLDGAGRLVWSQEIGPQAGEYAGMRYLSQRPVTVDNGLLYSFTAAGRLSCLHAVDGKILWEKEYSSLGGQAASFFYVDSPLVEGELLICKPGGSKGSLAALNKLTGAVVWQSSELKERAAAAPIVAAEIGGVRQLIVLSMENVAGVAVKTGKLLWRSECVGKVAVPMTPVYHDGIVYVSAGFGIGAHAFRVTTDAGSFKVEQIYEAKALENQRGGIVRIGDHLYSSSVRALQCAVLATGEVLWQDRAVTSGMVCGADGQLILRGFKGLVVLADATPEKYVEKGRFTLPEESREYNVSPPVVVGGRLYLRDGAMLYCYDLRGARYKDPPVVWNPPTGQLLKPAQPRPGPEEKGPDAAFVATPQDIVEKMLEMAKVAKDDVVYDLGSGEGRIVFTASRNHGCKSVGFEINPGLVRESRNKIKQAKLDELVTIEEKDLFTADLSPASVITLYLGEPNNAKLLPQLRKLKAGARIVSHQHLLGPAGPKPDQTLKIASKEDHEEHTIHLWTLPLQEGK